MAKFDWDKFKSGKLSVILRTKELAEDFYGECKKRGIDWDSSCDYAIWKAGGVQYEYYVSCKSLVWSSLKYCTNDSVEWKGKDNMEKTFREVIADIKEGEVWEQTDSTFVTDKIMCKDGQIIIDLKQRRSSFGTKGIFKLQREEYTFEEAFKAYEEGKEIESCRFKYKKINDEILYINIEKGYKDTLKEVEMFFTLEEIKGKWYIND